MIEQVCRREAVLIYIVATGALPGYASRGNREAFVLGFAQRMYCIGVQKGRVKKRAVSCIRFCTLNAAAAACSHSTRPGTCPFACRGEDQVGGKDADKMDELFRDAGCLGRGAVQFASWLQDFIFKYKVSTQ